MPSPIPARFLIPPGEPVPGEVVLSRFTLRHEVGEGGQGVVWRAEDPVRRETVALKFVRHTWGGPPRSLREVVALRLLDLPGLVRVVDAGRHGGADVIAMEWVEGRPFPGPRDGARWADLARPASLVAETLQRIHGAGLVHRDVKPSNVLVGPDGTPVLLDLGIAGGDALRDDGAVAGTPRYVPPEVLAGAAAGAGADLFALGVMLFEALAGAALRADPSTDVDALARPRVLERLVGRAPSEVAEVIAALVDPDPARRIADAEALVHALGGATTTPDEDLGRVFALRWPKDAGRDADVADAAQLAPLFDALERVVRDRSCAAEALFEESGGRPELARRALRAWLRAGIGTITGDRVRLVGHDVLRLRARRQADARVGGVVAVAALAGGADGAALVARVQQAARALERALDEGRYGAALRELPALHALAVELAAERSEAPPGGPDGEPPAGSAAARDARALADDLLATWLDAAVGLSARPALEHFLHAAERCGEPTPTRRAAVAIAQAAVAGLQGAYGRVDHLLTALGEPDCPRLAFAYHAVALRAGRARGAAPGAGALRAAEGWSERTGHAAGFLATWRGWHAYGAGDLRRASEEHARAAALLGGEARASALLSAALAAIWDDRPADALALVAEARPCVEGRAQLFLAVRAANVELQARYALGEELRPDLELQAILRESSDLTGASNAWFLQAAIGWRCGDVAAAGACCDEALALSRRAAHWESHALFRAFADHLGRAGHGFDAFDEVPTATPPGVVVQVAALLSERRSALVRAAAPRVAAAWREVAQRDPTLRREVLSLAEAHALLAQQGIDLDRRPG